MIIQAGMRTDIPAFYSEWFLNRIREGYVFVRNPYNPDQITRYELDPKIVDCIAFCTKNPTPLLPHLQELSAFGQFWFVTLTPYGKDIEPNVPDKHKIVESFQQLSTIVNKSNAKLVGASGNLDAVQWRYDPIFINEKYSVAQHIKSFEVMASKLAGYTHTCIISFIDLYSKVKKNFPEAREVSSLERIELSKAFVEIGKQFNIQIRTCAEGKDLEQYGVICEGCSTVAVIENALGLSQVGKRLEPPRKKFARAECQCVIGCDIGAYNTCPHLCRYCYANYSKELVLKNLKAHNPQSPCIIGNIRPGENIHPAKQESWIKDLRNDAFL